MAGSALVITGSLLYVLDISAAAMLLHTPCQTGVQAHNWAMIVHNELLNLLLLCRMCLIWRDWRIWRARTALIQPSRSGICLMNSSRRFSPWIRPLSRLCRCGRGRTRRRRSDCSEIPAVIEFMWNRWGVCLTPLSRTWLASINWPFGCFHRLKRWRG